MTAGLLVIAGCVPVAPADGPTPGYGTYAGGGEYDDGEYGGGGYGDGSGTYTAGSGGTFCDRMCQMRVECAGSTFADCLEGCNITASDLPPEAADELSCEDMRREAAADKAAAEDAARRGGTGRGNGSQCAARGIDDCPSMTICCHRLGRCESPGVCNMPTR